MKKVKLLVFLVLSLCFSVFVASAEEANAADMHRLYNPNSGEHFYTANVNEKNHLVKVGWKSEGIGWIAPANGNAVYRLYNANAGDHHYTLDASEKNHLVKVGWRYEGVGWYSDPQKAVPLYRAYNPNAKAGSHNYTVNYAEQKNLIRVGWRDEGIAWYGINKSSNPNTAAELQKMQNKIIQKVNELRRKTNGCNELKLDSKLTAAANVRGNELLKKYSHDRPNGSSYSTALAEKKLTYSICGENIAMISSSETSGDKLGEQMYNMWFNSKYHYLNMIDPRFTHIGVGVARSGSNVYGVQLFIGN